MLTVVLCNIKFLVKFFRQIHWKTKVLFFNVMSFLLTLAYLKFKLELTDQVKYLYYQQLNFSQGSDDFFRDN